MHYHDASDKDSFVCFSSTFVAQNTGNLSLPSTNEYRGASVLAKFPETKKKKKKKKGMVIQ
jgi:hypothetical protein